jgi:hypothetical protein
LGEKGESALQRRALLRLKVGDFGKEKRLGLRRALLEPALFQKLISNAFVGSVLIDQSHFFA